MALRRPSPALAASLALHVVLGAGLVRAVMDPGSLRWLLPDERAEPPKEERISYVAVGRAAGGEVTVGRAGGDGLRERPAARSSAPRLAAPRRVPATVPPPVAPGAGQGAGDASDEEGGTGPLVGGGGPLRGAQPRYGDGRVWRPADPVAPEAKTHIERLDSAFAASFEAHQDSMAILAKVRRPGDWTVAREDGSKYGIEPGNNGGMPKLWLGRVSIPLPVGLPVRPGQLERERALRAITNDVAQQSTRRLTEDEFRKAVRQIRERKEWERSRAGAANAAGGAPESAPRGDAP
jgi:hypothetical protein